MEELNKNQIVLLTLLVSFVTSIATGIVTVTLVNQAPPAVTQTINRIVEKTIPGETKTQTIIKEVPVIVTEEQLIVDVINSASPAMVRITDHAGLALGSGFVISDDGLIATVDKIFPTGPIETEIYQVFLSKSRQATARLVKSDAKKGVILLRLDIATIKDPENKDASKVSLAKLELTDAETLPGQTVLSLGVPDSGPLTVSGGIVSGLFTDTASSTSFINTSAANQNNIGGPLLNIKGKVIGISRDTGAALTAKMIQDTLNAIPK